MAATEIKLPIDVVLGSSPPRFVWRQVVGTMGGDGHKIVEQEGCLPPSVEGAVKELVMLSKRLSGQVSALKAEVANLRERLDKFEKDNAAATNAPAAGVSSRKGRG